MSDKTVSLSVNTEKLESQLDLLLEKANQLKATLMEIQELSDSLCV